MESMQNINQEHIYTYDESFVLLLLIKTENLIQRSLFFNLLCV